MDLSTRTLGGQSTRKGEAEEERRVEVSGVEKKSVCGCG